MWLCVVVLLLSKENAALAIMGLGLYATLVVSRVWLGIALLGIAALSGVVIMKVVMPLFRTDTWEHYNRLGPSAYWPEKAIYLYTLLKGSSLLAARAPSRHFSCAKRNLVRRRLLLRLGFGNSHP